MPVRSLLRTLFAGVAALGLNTAVRPNAFGQAAVAITNQPQSQAVVEGAAVVFVVGASGTPVPTFQWYRNDVALAGATTSSYTIPIVTLGDDSARFKVVLQNEVGGNSHIVTSDVATLSVTADLVPPVLTAVQAVGPTTVQLIFSERLKAGPATDLGHYAITNSSGVLELFGAALAGSQTNVILSVAPMTAGATYTVLVNELRDNSSAGNVIAPNSTRDFVLPSYTAIAVGNPQPTGGVTLFPDGLNLTAGGRDIGGTNDQFEFHYLPRTGDFDVKVRIDALTLADVWTEAGLVAREDVRGGSRFAATLATPSLSGTYFLYRPTTNGIAAVQGSVPVNYPNTWLRLQREGNRFAGYAGSDGRNWSLLGSTTLALPSTVWLGLAASSHNTNRTTTATFREFSEVTAPGATPGSARAEPLGQSSRRTSLVISEIQYNPLDRADGKNLEFVEIFNALSTPEDLSGWRLDGDADFTFPPNTVLAAGEFLVVAQVPADVQTVYGITGVLGPFSNTNSLPNSRGTVQLRNRIGAVFLEARYDTDPPWPAAADGAGHSLVLARPSFGEGNAEAWAASDSVGGSPGRLDPVTLDPLRSVRINELLANTDGATLDFIELYNHSAGAVDVSGCFLTDARDTNKFVIPSGIVLPPRGFLSYNQTQLGFALSSGGETVYLRNPARTRVLDAVRFGAQANGVASGRFPDGAPGFSELAAPTPGTTNSALLLRDIVINEIMYHPISEDSDDEYIELYNRGETVVNLSGWRLMGGASFTIPSGTTVAAGGYMVIARNATRLGLRYPDLNAENTVGDYSGSLANGGERITLAMADPVLTTNRNVVTTNFNYVVVDEVDYRDGGRWGTWSDGGGSSLELIDARSDNRLAANWADSEESRKARWTTVEVRGVIDNAASTTDQLQTLLMGVGECLIDDVQVVTMGGSNLVANSTFETGATGWTAEGTEERSGLETSEGFESTRSYRVRASGRGDNILNRIRTPLRAIQPANATNIIRAKVRWLRGHPEILFRLRGNGLEAAATMDLPTTLGTPGAPNSRAVSNAPPAISEVVHHPLVPAANEAVLVTARVHDPDGIGSVQVRYRVDPGATLTSVAMMDDGTAGDAVAGDGLYSALVPGSGPNALLAFHVQATDEVSPPATATFPNDAPVHECLVRFGESLVPGSFPSYRIWMTQASFRDWDTRNNLNNTLNDVTLVFGNHRVIYNAGATYAGSPYIGPSFTTPNGVRCGYTIEIPSDDPFLGDNALVLDWPGGHGGENTAVQEQMAYYIADQMDLPFSHRYFIRLAVNGVTDMQRGGVFEAVLQPGGEFLRQWSPEDSEGDFYKIDRAFEFSDAGQTLADPQPQLLLYSTPDLATGGIKKKTEKYRWFWLKRGSARAHDYTNVFSVADAINAAAPEPYTSQTEALVDVEQWMGIFAAEHIINNFDSWGHAIGKNMYMFKPSAGRWQLYMFDLDWLMLVSSSAGYSTSSGLFESNDPAVTRMYNHPPFRRAYFRAVQNAVTRAFVPAKYEALMDAKYASLVANGITQCDGQTLVNPGPVKSWFNQRRTFLAAQLNPLNPAFAITNNGGNDFTATTNLITLSGTAPLSVQGILVNGVRYPVRWISVTNWSARVLLRPGENTITVGAFDTAGNVLSSFTDTIRVTTTTPTESPVGRVVINEIMYHPAAPGAEFVELVNTSRTSAFDLSGWRVEGVDFTFPTGTLLDPGAFLVVAENRETFAAAYGGGILVSGEFGGSLNNGGETLSLVQPSPVSGGETLIDSVTYDTVAPWPTQADGRGSSLQLIDATQDNRRVANWSDGSGWRFLAYTGVPGTNATNVQLFLPRAGEVHLDNVSLVEGTQAEAGINLLENSGFESGALGSWAALGNHSNSVVTPAVARSGNFSLRIVSSGIGNTTNALVAQALPAALEPATAYTLSFWYLPSVIGTGVNFRVTGLFRSSNAIPYRPLFATPGAANVPGLALPPFPEVWLNELQPNNLNGITDNAGDREPWVELYNPGPNGISLEGWHLTDNYSNLTRWPFPIGASLRPGEFWLVWLDGEPGEATPDAWHTSFRSPPSIGSLALVFPLAGQPAVLDYIHYASVPAGRSVGLHPDGQSGPPQSFAYPTPGGTNDSTVPLLQIFINEWMAANTRVVADPVGGKFDDWFELYNPNPVAVELTGYSLSDRLEDPSARWTIPAGRSIAPGGFLLVWADEETEQNAATSLDLHAAFKLSQGGEAIGLFAPDGRLVDAVTFGAQTNDISQGRWPDGAAARYFMSTPTPRGANVLAAPPGETRILALQVGPSGDLTVSWSAEAGVRYRVQTQDRLGAEVWVDLNEVVASSTVASSTFPFNGSPQRFVRIQRQ